MSDHILHSVVLKGDGTWTDLKSAEPSGDFEFHWFHMYRESINTQKWLFENEFDELVIESLTDEDTRPRTTVFPDGVLLNLRAVNIHPDEDPHEMLSMRMFIQKNRVISTSLREMHVLKDIMEVISGEFKPTSRSEFLAYVIELITDRIESYISEHRDAIYELECSVLDRTDSGMQSTVSDIRRSVITFARYLSPQREALVKLLSIKEKIFNEDDRIVVTESINSTSRFLEEIESVNNRCHILKDDMTTLSAEKMNKNMYLLSIMTAVFLPLSFLTGLFGVNLGGIPGAEDISGFRVFTIVLIAVLIIQLILLRISRRF